MSREEALDLIGSESRWRKLEYGLSLKPGDLVSACHGYNERIEEIEPDVCEEGGGWAIFDFSIHTISGNNCSLVHCCTFPLETREEIIAYFRGWGSPEAVASGLPYCHDPKVAGVMDGREVFDQNGEPRYEYCNVWERKARFPARLMAEMAGRPTPQSQRGKATDWDGAYIEGWTSFMEVWHDEDNPYQKSSPMHWGYREGRGHANEVMHHDSAAS